MTEAPPWPRLAVLIDAENVSAGYWPAITAALARLGRAAVVRAYVCHAPSPGWCAAEIEIIDGRPAGGPNAADFLMAMDAAVMAVEKRVDGFALVTGDDGFSAVALDIKRRDMLVYALVPLNGGSVPRHLAAVADLTVLLPPANAVASPAPPSAKDDLDAELCAAMALCPVVDEGWVGVGELGTALKRVRGKKLKGKLTDIVARSALLEVRGKASSTEVRLKNATYSLNDPDGLPL